MSLFAVEPIASALVEGAVEASFLVLCGGLAATLVHGVSRARQAIWWLVLAACLALPLIGPWTSQRSTGWLPRSILGSGWQAAALGLTAGEVAATDREGSASSWRTPPAPGLKALERTGPEEPEGSLVSQPWPEILVSAATPPTRPSPGLLGRSEKSSASVSAALIARASRAAPKSVAGWLVSLWTIGFVLALLWQGLGLASIARLTRAARPAGRFLDREVRRQAERLGVAGPIRLLTSDRVAVPMTWGWLRPVVLLPSDAAAWPPERQRMVLLHEIAHIKHRDWILRSLARAILAVYWFQPLVWWARRRLILEQELACDQVVVGLGQRPSQYASELLRLAHSTTLELRAPVPVAALQMAHKSQMEVRVMSILEPRKKTPSSVTFCVVLAVALMVPVLTAMTPWQERATASLEAAARELAQIEARSRPIEDAMRALEVELELPENELLAIERRLDPEHQALEALQLELRPLERDLEQLARHHQQLAERLEPIELQPAIASAELAVAIAPIEAALAVLAARLEPLQAELAAREESMARGQQELQAAAGAKMAKLERAAELARAAQELGSSHGDREVAELHRRMEQLNRELEPFHRQMDELRREMEPVLLEMEPLHREMEQLHQRLSPALAQARADMAPFEQRMAELQRELAPIREQMQQVQERMAPVHQRMEEVRARMAPAVRDMEAVAAHMAPVHERMAELHARLAPLHLEMEQAQGRLQKAVRSGIAAILEQELGLSGEGLERMTREVTSSVHFELEDGTLWVQGSKSRLERLLGERAINGSGGAKERVDVAIDRILSVAIDIQDRRRP